MQSESAVVGRGALHALGRGGEPAVEVPGADDDGDVDARRAHDRDLGGEALHHSDVDAVVALAHQRLAGELQHHAPKAGVAGLRHVDRLLGSNAHRRQPASAKRWNSSTSAPASSSTFPTVLLPSWTQSWSASTFAPKKRLPSMPSTIFSRACSGLDNTSSVFA